MVCYDVVHIRSYEIENSFSRLKLFNILTLPFRGELDRVHVIAQVCAQLVNVDLEFRPLRRSSNAKVLKYVCLLFKRSRFVNLETEF